MRGRDRLEIINDILDIIRSKGDQIKPTHIMYKANLSSEMLNSYMKELLTKGFITEKIDRKDKRTYALTEKGFNFLRDYKIIKGFVDSYDLKE
jgi:predicted transcriptional regulator